MKFQDLLRELNVRFETEGKYCRPGWLQFRCPFCHHGSDPDKLYAGLALSSGAVNCWRCGRHRLGDTLAALTGLPVAECVKRLKTVYKEQTAKERPRGTLRIPAGVGPLLPCHTRYLRGRGFAPRRLVRLWGLAGIGLAPRLAWRVWVPMHRYGEVVSWTTRAIGNTPARYISASEQEESWPHKKLLYGHDYVRHTCTVHEGPADVWRVGPGAVATWGTGFSTAQVNLLARIPVRYICFDNEPEAQRRAEELCATLALFEGETYNITLDAKDAGEATEREIKQLRKACLE